MVNIIFHFVDDDDQTGQTSGAMFDGVRLADDNYADDLSIDIIDSIDERHLNTGQDEIEAPRAKNPGKCEL